MTNSVSSNRPEKYNIVVSFLWCWKIEQTNEYDRYGCQSDCL